MGIEDLIFTSALEAQGIKRTQSMYKPSTYPHSCSMCGNYPSGYELKTSFVEKLGRTTPYIFICEECRRELPL